MIGGGQLARMSAEAATALGIGFRVLAQSPIDPAAQVVRDLHIGSHEDIEALLAFAEGCEVVTFDHEHVPPAYLEQLEALGVAVRPGPARRSSRKRALPLRPAWMGRPGSSPQP